MKLRNWFNHLPRREQNFLLAGFIALLFYLVYGVFYSGLVDGRDRLRKQNAADMQTLAWMKEASATIRSLRGASGVGGIAGGEGKTLSQLSEMAARRADLRITRFQPKEDVEAQVWLDNAEFDKLVVFISGLEMEYGLSIHEVTINASGGPGLVNVRLKFGR
jgi:type II secretory pathway component PulM